MAARRAMLDSSVRWASLAIRTLDDDAAKDLNVLLKWIFGHVPADYNVRLPSPCRLREIGGT
ncbi:hypothetical protein CPB84DRAFT_1783069 [Gymnopilus junonius]|uniref:Uncharacterized protein n=1 Tax=Gymnopilus junonius TaxID=109634 RepID=A0A9P5TKL0_GYMJU|nr:hypothetical protein CPB84DRAFT_1783069 [Gymnopilus junonius]